MTAAPFISRKTGQFSYFAQQLGTWNWQQKNVLDFGGNIGNILRDPSSTIDPARYWCLDVVEESIARGRERWPEGHWHFYDRRCFYFNPAGVPRLPVPDLGVRFDYIVAYSVFPNTDRTDMLQLVEDLQQYLADGGALAFTYMDPHYHPWQGYDGTNFIWRLRKERGELTSAKSREIFERAFDAEWCILVNGDDLYVGTEEIRPYPPKRQRTHHTFYTTAYMRALFPDAEIREPVDGEMQHCCIVRKR
jgi:hypothetical protein